MIERPVPGQRLRAGWGAEVADRLNAAGAFASPGMLAREGAGGSTVALAPENRRDRRGGAAQPQPFEVRFDQTLNDNQGGLKIFLAGDRLVAFDNTYVATSAFSGIAAITGQDGWYELSGVNLQSHAAVYLTLTASAAPQVALTYAPAAQTEGGAYVFSICIALFSYTPATSTAPDACAVTQQTVGALYIGKRPAEPEPCGYPGVDDVSIDENGQTSGESSGGTLQIKGFAAGTPVSSTTLAADLQDSGTASAIHLLCREAVHGGATSLKYKPVGSLSLFSLAGTLTGVADVRYDAATQQLQKKMFSLTPAGAINVDANWQMIEGGQAVEETV